SGNRVELLRNGEQIFPAMLAAIEGATRSIDLLTFVYWTGDISAQFADALTRAAERGVRVRVLLDGVGAKPLDPDLVDRMCDGGADVRFFRPPNPLHPLQANHRTHRKVMVCDETVAFTGGVGIADVWLGDGRTQDCWRDTHVRVEGPAVNGLRAAFLDNWIEVDPTLFDPEVDRFPEPEQPGDADVQVVLGTAEPGWNQISMTVRALVDLACERIRITTAYFVPDDDLAGRLVAASERGVDVQLLLPGPGADKRFVQLAGEERYEPLLDAGIEIWNYRPSMLHAKTMTVDGSVGVIGSANFNHRSTSLDDEVNLVVFDRAVAGELDADFDADLEYSERIDLTRWRHRGLPQRLLEEAMHRVRPFL
ncbi:MAG: cardiolipin synthase B, partial [Ilumatobacter sp.]|nr:cardiolipin synthase B [Ilumatobacter sp.]